MGSRPDLPVFGAAPLAPAAVPKHALSHRWDYRFARAMLELQAREWTGAVEVYAEGVFTTLYLHEGRPVFVGGGLPADSLGRVLAQRGWITESQLTEVVEHRMSIQGRRRFGEVAAALGILDGPALATALDEQVRDKVMRCLHWEHGEIALRPAAPDAAKREGVPLSVEPLLLSGIRLHYAAARAESALEPFLDCPVVLCAARERVAQRFQLSLETVAVLDAAVEADSIGAFLTGLAEGRLAATQLLCALALSDQLSLPTRSLRDARRAGNAALEEAAAPTLADNDQFHLHSSHPAPTATASTPASGVPSRDKLMADSAFLQGRELLRVREFAAAADAFKTAEALRPGAREYALHAAWAAYWAGDRNPRWRARLEAQCRGALHQDRHLAFAHHVLGRLALEDGDHDTARAELGRALELDPSDAVAAETLTRLPR